MGQLHEPRQKLTVNAVPVAGCSLAYRNHLE